MRVAAILFGLRFALQRAVLGVTVIALIDALCGEPAYPVTRSINRYAIAVSDSVGRISPLMIQRRVASRYGLATPLHPLSR